MTPPSVKQKGRILWLSRRLLPKVSFTGSDRSSDGATHSSRAGVACLVAEGMSNQDIANRLKLREHTVRNYLFHIFEKLGLSSRVELTLYALSQRKRLI